MTIQDEIRNTAKKLKEGDTILYFCKNISSPNYTVYDIKVKRISDKGIITLNEIVDCKSVNNQGINPNRFGYINQSYDLLYMFMPEGIVNSENYYTCEDFIEYFFRVSIKILCKKYLTLKYKSEKHIYNQPDYNTYDFYFDNFEKSIKPNFDEAFGVPRKLL